jgi:hypothetical protein
VSHEWIEAIAAAISALFAFAAIIVSVVAMRRQDRLASQQQKLETRLANEQNSLEQRLATERADLDTKLAKQRENFDRELARTDRLYSQRSALLDLWKYISDLDQINPNDPVTPDIMKAVHALELVALCCEGSVVDRDLVRRTFRQPYIELYDQIEQVTEIPGLHKSGKKLLGENPAAMKLYHEFKNELMIQDQLKPIGA